MAVDQVHRNLFAYDPTVGYRFVPGLKARVEHESGGYLVQTNSAGFRCRHEFAARRRSDTYRILLFGDSYTAGDGVSNKFRYGDVLEDLVPGIEVYNFGLPGTGTDQHYLLYRDVSRDFEHDLVVLGLLVENVRRIAARYRNFQDQDGGEVVLAKPYFSRQPGGALEVHNIPVPKDPVPRSLLTPEECRYVDEGGRFSAAGRIVSRLGNHVKEPLQRLTRYQPFPAYNDQDNADWRLLKQIVTAWATETGTPLLVFVIPVYHYVEGMSSARPYQSRFRELQTVPNLSIHDPLPELLAYPAAERRGFRFARDCHPTRAGHEALARSLVPSIEQFQTKRAG